MNSRHPQTHINRFRSHTYINHFHSHMHTNRFRQPATRGVFLLIGLVVAFSLNASETQAQKITVEVNVACDDSGVNDAQVWIGGTLVDLSAPPRATARVEIDPGTYVIKASRKSFPNAVIKDIYASNLEDQFPKKYEPASPGGDISLTLDRQSRSPSGLDYSMRIDLEGCLPGGGGPAATPTPSPSPVDDELADVEAYVTRRCRSDVKEEFIRPLLGASVQIGDKEYETEKLESVEYSARALAKGLRPGQYKMTVLLPAEDQDYELDYVLSGFESVRPGEPPAEKYYSDQTSYALVPVKKGWQTLTFRLIGDCLRDFSQNYRYVVLKLKNPLRSDVRYGDQKLGHPPLNEGGTVGNGDLIETSSDSAVLLQAQYVGPGQPPSQSQYYLIVHPNTAVRLFFIKRRGNEFVPSLDVKYGTISQKVLENPPGGPRSEKNSRVTVQDPTTVGFDDGTIFSWSYDRARQETTISVEEGAVAVKPQNPRLQRVTISAGQQVQVTQNGVSPIRPAARISEVDFGNGVSLARVGKSGGGAGGTTAAGSGGTGGTTAGGIGGTWTAPTGEIIEIIQKGSRITGRYRGILGIGEISGTFDGKNLSATVQPNQGLLPLAIPLRLTLTEGGKLLGRLETPLLSGSLVFTKNR